MQSTILKRYKAVKYTFDNGSIFKRVEQSYGQLSNKVSFCVGFCVGIPKNFEITAGKILKVEKMRWKDCPMVKLAYDNEIIWNILSSFEVSQGQKVFYLYNLIKCS